MSGQTFYEGLVNPVPGQPGAATVTFNGRTKYYNTIVQVQQNGAIDSSCAEIAFLNVGDGNFPTPAGADVVVLGFTVKVGFGISFDGEECELDVTKYTITFQGGGVRNCSVFRKMYVTQ